MMLTTCQMPNERCLRQVHEEIQMVTELLEETLLKIFLQIATEQLAHLIELCCAIFTFHKLTLYADCKTLFAHLVAKRNNTIVILGKDGTNDISQQFEGEHLCSLWRQNVGILELKPYLYRVHVVLNTELLPAFVILIK